MQGLRTDIQVLRAVAVLSVLVYHFGVPGLPQGFLGVDIFFVISGYLMGGVILGEMDAGRFRPAHFYLRRARRLLPAAFATLLLTTLATPFVLTPSLLADYAAQLAGAASFSANIVLWRQSGYFDGQAALKPLLHTWSLALEEQFYFLLPAVLMLASKLGGARGRGAILIGLLLASMAACWWWLPKDPEGTFYLLHTRAWELLIGSACALPALRRLAERLRLPFDSAWIALPLLALCLTVGTDPVHPRGDALLVCLATALLIVSPSAALGSRHIGMRPLQWVGDRSYSLYLVHWPLLALARSVWLEGVPAGVHLVLLLLSFLLAHLSYEWVEQPMRRIETAQALALRLMWLGLPLLAASGMVWTRLQPASSEAHEVDWQQALRPNYGFARVCDQDGAFKPRTECASAARPRTLLWGDSHAMHLVPALLASAPKGGILQATRSACAPLLDMARRMPHEPASRARGCMAFNEAVLAHLAQSRRITYVVIAARWDYLLSDPIFDARGQRIRPDAQMLSNSLSETIARVHRLGKKVILVSSPPSVGPEVNLGLCAERRMLDLWTVTPSLDAQCRFDQSAHELRHAQVRAMLRGAGQATRTPVLWLDDFTCHGGHCQAILDGQPLYRDADHLSHAGSRALGTHIDLGRLIADQAR